MNDLIPTGQISGFTSKTASVGGVRLHETPRKSMMGYGQHN